MQPFKGGSRRFMTKMPSTRYDDLFETGTVTWAKSYNPKVISTLRLSPISYHLKKQEYYAKFLLRQALRRPQNIMTTGIPR